LSDYAVMLKRRVDAFLKDARVGFERETTI